MSSQIALQPCGQLAAAGSCRKAVSVQPSARSPVSRFGLCSPRVICPLAVPGTTLCARSHSSRTSSAVRSSASEEASARAQDTGSRAQSAASRAGDEAKAEVQEPTEQAKFVSEFTATALFNFLTCTAFGASTQAAGGNAVRGLAYSMGAYGLIFVLIISIFAPISKAHFNPMVTASMVVSGQQTLQSGVGYIIAQCLGGILGAALAFWTMPGAQQNATYLGAAAVPASRSVAQAFLGELVAAAVFIYVLFATIVSPSGWGKLGPLSLGLTVPLLMWTVGPVSSLCINPARALGPAVVTGVWKHHWIYWLAPIIGGGIAAKVYATLFQRTAEAA